jgi:hypothetical protein
MRYDHDYRDPMTEYWWHYKKEGHQRTQINTYTPLSLVIWCPEPPWGTSSTRKLSPVEIPQPCTFTTLSQNESLFTKTYPVCLIRLLAIGNRHKKQGN